MNFNFFEAVKALGVNGAFFVITGMKNRKSDDEFDKMRDSFLRGVEIGSINDKIRNSAVLRGFRELHEAVGCPGKKHVSAPENLFNYFAGRGSLPSINLIVDIYNFVSFHTEMAIGAHDTRFISGDVDLRLTDGTEAFWPLGYSKAVPVRAGEYCYVDGANDVLCRLEVRQVEKTKVIEDTTGCLYIVQGNRATPAADIAKAAEELIDLTVGFCGGTAEYLYRIK